MSIINTIQADAISRQSDRAKYALLKSFAQYKNYIDVDNDSLPAQALAYYRGKGNKEEMISLFMNAEKANEAKFYEESLALDLEGLNCAEKLNDTLFIARFHQLAGSLYDNTYKRTESSKHYHKAYEYFELAGKSIHALFSLYDYAVALIGLSQFQEAQQIFFRIQESTDSFDLCNLKANAIGGLMRIDMETGDWESVKRRFEELKDYQDCFILTPHHWAALSMALVNLGDLNGAEEALTIAESIPDKTGSPDLTRAWIVYYQQINDFASAQNKTRQLLDFQNSEIRKLQRMVAHKGEEAFVNNEFIKFESQANQQKRELIISLIILSLLTGIVVLLSVIHANRQRTKIDKHMGEILALTGSQEVTEKEIEKLNLRLESMERIPVMAQSNEKQLDTVFTSQLESLTDVTNNLKSLLDKHVEMIGDLCADFFIEGNLDINQQLIYNRVKEKLISLKEEIDNSHLFEVIDKCFGGVISRLKNKDETFNSESLNFLSLLLAVFSLKSICLMNNIGNKAYYSKRDSLIKKLSKSESIVSKEILVLLSQRYKNIKQLKSLM